MGKRKPTPPKIPEDQLLQVALREFLGIAALVLHDLDRSYQGLSKAEVFFVDRFDERLKEMVSHGYMFPQVGTAVGEILGDLRVHLENLADVQK